MANQLEFRTFVATALVAAACASPKATPAPLPEGQVPLDSADAEYVKMGVAAASRVKEVASDRVIGLYQTNAKTGLLRGLVKSVIAVYGFTEIHTGDARMVCAQPRPKRGNVTVVDLIPNCGFDVVEVLVQFNYVQIVRDTGYVGGQLAEIPHGSDKVRTTAFCLLAARHGNVWDGVSYGKVEAPQDCTADGKH